MERSACCISRSNMALKLSEPLAGRDCPCCHGCGHPPTSTAVGLSLAFDLDFCSVENLAWNTLARVNGSVSAVEQTHLQNTQVVVDHTSISPDCSGLG